MTVYGMVLASYVVTWEQLFLLSAFGQHRNPFQSRPCVLRSVVEHAETGHMHAVYPNLVNKSIKAFYPRFIRHRCVEPGGIE